MNDPEVAEQFRLLQQELTLTGDTLQSMQRDSRAALGTLRLEVEVLRRCLFQLHPEFTEQYAAMRAQLIHEIDPEAPTGQA